MKVNPGLVVMGGGSCLRGHEFESQSQKLDESFYTSIFCKIVPYWSLKQQKMNEKEAGGDDRYVSQPEQPI